MQRPQLCQSAQQAPEPLWSPSRSSALGPTNPGQQVQDQLLHFFHTVCGLKGGSVCRDQGGVVRGKQEVSCRLLTVCDVSLSETHDVICLGEVGFRVGAVVWICVKVAPGPSVGVRFQVGIRVWFRVGL